jgi:hypothetical protein
MSTVLAKCLSWEGTLTADGYPVGQIHRKVAQAPSDKVVHHICGNKKCVNPDHLQVLTQAHHSAYHKSQMTHAPCGHEYDATDHRGTRYCRPCKLEYYNNYNRTRR